MFCAGAGSQAQHAQQGLSLQQGHSSSSYSSADSRATEHAVADTLTAGNSTQSALPGQQDSLVDKVVGKLLPAAVTSKEAAEPEENSQVAGPNGAYYGGVLDSAGNQTLNDSTGRIFVQETQHALSLPLLMLCTRLSVQSRVTCQPRLVHLRSGVFESCFACCAPAVRCLTAVVVSLTMPVCWLQHLLWQVLCQSCRKLCCACFAC